MFSINLRYSENELFHGRRRQIRREGYSEYHMMKDIQTIYTNQVVMLIKQES